MNITDQTALSGIIPEGDQASFELPPGKSTHSKGFFCPKMQDWGPSLENILEAVLGNNADNVSKVCYSDCKNQCFN
jgi:hypothetical protein